MHAPFIGIPTIVMTAMLAFAGVAEAGSFQASPTRVTLGPDAKSAVVTVLNQGEEPMQLQVTAFEWSEAATGQMSLTPSDGLTVFPMMLSLAPGESRRVRVGVPAIAAGAAESSFRIIIEELPAPKGDAPVTAIAVRLRMSIPVFVQPAGIQPSLAVEKARVEGGSLKFDLHNNGKRFTKASKIKVHVDLASGPLDTTLDGWYVLAQGTRSYDLPLPAGACAKNVAIRVDTEEDGAVEHAATFAAPCR